MEYVHVKRSKNNTIVRFTNGAKLRPTFRRATVKPLVSSFEVNKCPKVKTLKHVNKNRLLGVWFAYATTPLDLPVYQRRCASYNVQNSRYFNTNILFTDYKHFLITYACTHNDQTKKYNVKLRILTRTRTPLLDNLNKALFFLESIAFPIEKLEFLKAEAFCFEWYILNYHVKPRPGRHNSPTNIVWDH
ncbi:uncharacterized protein LOC119548446 isoform X2 [Drosophila subpulchrella]|uniref:uncharacterized protein LOC119548446 isoform X2 n=1 Tax=Drosophila subpulchrella TaxID=1486046 RepID=UPI0018A1B3DE|nr:uncharacterized protein LOC119548446 isoform X2 [Drosophila subpulchrella]